MLLNRQITSAGFFLFYLFAPLCAVEGVTAERFEEDVIASSESLMSSLLPDNDPTEDILLTKWKDHFEACTAYSCSDYKEAIHILQREYSDLLDQYEQCQDTSKMLRENYDPEWLNRLIAHFGIAHLKDKEKSIVANLLMTVSSSQENCCGQIMEKVFYKEAALHGAYRYYVNLFLDFYKDQPLPVQNTLKPRKETAEKFLKKIELTTVEKLFFGRGLPHQKLSEIQARNTDKAIYEYFKNNQHSCNIDGFKEIEEFRKAIRKK